MVHIIDADDAPPVVRGLAVIDDGGFVTMGEGGTVEKSNFNDYKLTLLTFCSQFNLGPKIM